MPPPNSPGADFLTKLFDQTLAAAAASIDTGANGVAGAFTHLMIVAMLRTSQSGVDGPGLRFNNDSGSNYDRAGFRNDTTFSGTGRTSIDAMIAVGSSADANTFAQNHWWIPNYSDATTRKVCSGTIWAYQGSGTGNLFTGTMGGRWSSTNAITRIAVVGVGANLDVGSRLTIYGMP